VFPARLGQRERVPGAHALADQEPWIVERLCFPHCKMHTPWAECAFGVDVNDTYDRQRRALGVYTSLLSDRSRAAARAVRR
jgi:hypothetical protein